MRKIEEMSEDEIYSMSDEDIRILINETCMEEGVRLGMPYPKPDDKGVKPVVPVGRCFTIPQLKVAVMKAEDAMEITKFLGRFELYGMSYDYTTFTDTIGYPITSLSFTEIPMYSPADTVFQSKEAAERNRKAREYESKLEEWKANEERRVSIAVDIYERVGAVQSRINRFRELARVFANEYMPLVDNDVEKAMAFFKKAYGDNQELEDYIRKGIQSYPLFNDNIE